MLELFPDKFTPIGQTLPGEAARILEALQSAPQTVGQLFASFKANRASSTFDDLVSCLTFLYAADLIEQTDQMVRVVR